MPGKTIGTQLNPSSEEAWQGRILIRRTGRMYDLEFQAESGNQEISALVHQRLNEVVQRLNRGS